jgi:hypothetical protein
MTATTGRACLSGPRQPAGWPVIMLPFRLKPGRSFHDHAMFAATCDVITAASAEKETQLGIREWVRMQDRAAFGSDRRIKKSGFANRKLGTLMLKLTSCQGGQPDGG